MQPPELAQLQDLFERRQFAAIVEALPAETDAQVADYPLEVLYILSKSLRVVGSVPSRLRVARELVRQQPQNLKNQAMLIDGLRVAGKANEVDAACVAALDCFPSHPDILSRWIGSACDSDRLDEAETRLVAARQQVTETLEMIFLEAQIAASRRDFPQAASILRAAVPRFADSRRSLLSRAAKYSLYDRIARQISPQVGSGRISDYAVLVVNLDEHTDKLARFASQIADDGPAVHRVAGVRGRYLPNLAAARLADKESQGLKGTLGCFLAHVAAWERMLALDLPHALIAEDDAHLILQLPPDIQALGPPPGYDLCFAGYGMEPPPPPNSGTSNSLTAWPVAAAIVGRDPTWQAPGAYGYFLSRAGAEKLLRFIERDGYVGDVDWRLIAYSTDQTVLTSMDSASLAVAMLRLHWQAIHGEERLRSYALFPCLVRPGRMGSLRRMDNTVKAHPRLELSADSNQG